MRFLIALSIALGMGMAAAQAGPQHPEHKKGDAAASKGIYCCPKCQMAKHGPGKCEHCKATMVKAEYGCVKCKMGSAKPADCSKCHAKMAKINSHKEHKAQPKDPYKK